MKFVSNLAAGLAFYLALLALGCICLGWSVFAFPIQRLVAKSRGRRIGRSVISRAFRGYFRFTSQLGLTRFEIDALDALNSEFSLVLAANHPTLLDAAFILSRLNNVGCIMKSSILENAFLGAGARLAGYIRNDRPHGMVRDSVEDLQQGSQLLIFPEGTRTVRAPVNEFKGGFALIARNAGVRVQTLLIETDSPFLTKGWPIWRRPPAFPIHYRARLGERFEVGDDASAFARDLQRYFEHELDKENVSAAASSCATAEPAEPRTAAQAARCG